jgi:hypothetical protein
MFIKNHVKILIHMSAISFLMAIKRSRTYDVLMFSQQLYTMWTCQRADFGKQVNYSEWYCIPQWYGCWKCWNNYPLTLILKESACTAYLKDINVRPDGPMCCSVCRTSALIWIGQKHIPRVNSDLPWDVVALCHSRVKAVSQGSSTTQTRTRCLLAMQSG